jgi:negative regulator of sigma E activity
MKERDKEILSAMLDGQAGARDIQRILGQAHDETVKAYWRALNRQQDLLHESVAAWSAFDVSEGVALAIGSEAVSSSVVTGPKPPAPAAALTLERPEFVQAPGLVLGGRPTSVVRVARKPPFWISLAVAASVMFISILFLESWQTNNLGADEPAVADSASGAMVEQAAPSLAHAGFDSSEAQLAAVNSDDAYEERLRALLTRHAENAAVRPGSGVVPLARLTSFQAGQR